MRRTKHTVLMGAVMMAVRSKIHDQQGKEVREEPEYFGIVGTKTETAIYRT